jgi:hypothetical protein
LGWNRERFFDAGLIGEQLGPSDGGMILVVGRDARPFDQMQNPDAFFKHLEKYCQYDALVKRLGERPGVVVIDSLNVLRPEDRGKHFLDLVYKLRGPFLLIVILDTAADGVGDPFWTFAVDAVIRLTQSERQDQRLGTYLLGEFRVAKARWQKHALGPHQLKIFGKIDPDSVHASPNRKNYHGTGHLPPFRKDGGIQLYQSIHRHLSEGQKLSAGWESAPVAAATIDFDSSSLPSLDTEIGGGFPRGRCTAIVGDRGSLKSHLAYLWLLWATSTHGEPALLLSLRDDEAEAMSRLRAIFDVERNRGLCAPSQLIDNELLRVVHFRPGYIAPDEFMFRLWFHVNDFKPRRVVIASIEQLDTLFPLCSVEPVFVPSIVDVLAASRITTVAIGVTGGSQPPTQYGLLPQSSLILSFTADSAGSPGRIRLKVNRLPTARRSGGGGWISLDATTNQLQFAAESGTRPSGVT